MRLYFSTYISTPRGGTQSTNPFVVSGQIVVAGKVDREVLPWLNFTVRFLIRMLMTGVMTMAVIMMLTDLAFQSVY